ncbi:MAG TPA: proline dehydrogenase family protein [Planctomycetota bacterium]|nr:proline dehydrogenase family protein [Planctomycetota bacterium]
MSLFDWLVTKMIPVTPKAVVRRVASRYVAGEELDDAVRVLKELQAEGCRGTLDVLGEFVTERRQAEETARAYVAALDAISREALDSGVSIKLTAFGLDVAPGGDELCYQNARMVVEKARSVGRFVRIDMENSPYTDRTIAVYKRLRADFADVGIVLQARMKRTLADVATILPWGPDFRICKGIYLEPPEIAWTDGADINRAYLQALEAMLRGGARVGIATHDEALVEGALKMVAELRTPADRFEFQMLLGVQEGLRRRLRAAGHPVRVYVPYGRDWYGYSCRRLRENPAIAGHVVRAMFRRDRGPATPPRAT